MHTVIPTNRGHRCCNASLLFDKGLKRLAWTPRDSFLFRRVPFGFAAGPGMTNEKYLFEKPKSLCVNREAAS